VGEEGETRAVFVGAETSPAPTTLEGPSPSYLIVPYGLT
jgi:hypothetical protein